MCAVKSRVNWDASTGWEMNMKDVNCLSLFLDHCFCYLRSLSLTMIFPLTVSVSSNLDKTYRHSTDLFIYCFLSIFHVNSIVTCDIHCIRTTIIDTSNIPTPACMMRFSALTMFLNEFPNLSSMKSLETRIRIRWDLESRNARNSILTNRDVAPFNDIVISPQTNIITTSNVINHFESIKLCFVQSSI